MLETDELVRSEETGSRKWRLKSLILEGEMSLATNLVSRFGPRMSRWWQDSFPPPKSNFLVSNRRWQDNARRDNRRKDIRASH